MGSDQMKVPLAFLFQATCFLLLFQPVACEEEGDDQSSGDAAGLDVDVGNDAEDMDDVGVDSTSDALPRSDIDFDAVDRGSGIGTINCSCVHVQIEPGWVKVSDYLTGETFAETTFPLFITNEDPTAVYIWSATLVNNNLTCYDIIIAVEVSTMPLWLAVHNFVPVAWQGYPEAPDRLTYENFTSCGVRGTISVTQVESADQTASGTWTDGDCSGTVEAAYDLAVVENQTVTVDLVIDPHPGGTAENPWDNPVLGSAMPAGTLESTLTDQAIINSTLDFLETIHEDITVDCPDPEDDRQYDFDGEWVLEDGFRQDEVNQSSLALHAYLVPEGRLVLALWDEAHVIGFNLDGTILTDVPSMHTPGEPYEFDVIHRMDTLYNEWGMLDEDGLAFVGVPENRYEIVARPPQMSPFAGMAGLIYPGFTKTVVSSVEMRLERYRPLGQ